MIVCFPAGGGSDISMRLLADALSKQIKVPVVVLNKPGAGGAIGHREIVNAKPDGYTIGMFSSGGIALPYLNAQANTFDELQPIAFYGEDPNALEASNASGIAYEIQGITAFVNLRSIINGPVRRVGVPQRYQHVSGCGFSVRGLDPIDIVTTCRDEQFAVCAANGDRQNLGVAADHGFHRFLDRNGVISTCQIRELNRQIFGNPASCLQCRTGSVWNQPKRIGDENETHR